MSLSTEIVAKNDSQKLTDSAVNPLLHSSLPYLVFGKTQPAHRRVWAELNGGQRRDKVTRRHDVASRWQ